ncbi:MAG: glycosyl hydrolase family 65 protein [Verrucomicrobiota bacterium]
MRNPWQVRSNNFVNHEENIMRAGNIYQLANGYMGYRGTLDEFGPAELVGITLAGIYDRVGDAWREPVNAPNGGFTRLTVDGESVSARHTPIENHEQSLNLQTALFERKTTYRVRGHLLTVTSSRFLSAEEPHLGVIHYGFTSEKACRVTLHTGIDSHVWDLNGPHLEQVSGENRDGVLLVHALTHENSKAVAVAEAVDLGFGVATGRRSEHPNLREITIAAEAGQTYAFYKYFAVFTDLDAVDQPAGDAAASCVCRAKAAGYQTCLQRHTALWADRWARCDVKIEGDAQAQLALRYSILQLLMVAPVNGSGNSIPARALSGQVYKGAIFWDTEMFMFPFFLHTCPEKARELMRYRIKTLEGARRKARTEGVGFKGAFYAWESQETGDDACTYFNIGDPVTKRDLRTYFRDKQVHISGDVAIAMWEYFKLTGDDTLLLEGGGEVILECARFYYSYAYFNQNKRRYEILDVVGPDEYHERINNNAFTNMVARATFEIAGRLISHLREQHPAQLAALVKKLHLAGELPQLLEAAGLLYVPQPDARTRVIEQFDTFFKLADTTVEALKARMIHPHEYLGAGQGLAVPTQVIKQADVIMMLNLFKDRYPQRVKVANWEYYEPRTEHGSSLSACAYAMVAADIGKLTQAYAYFLKTAKIDLEANYKVQVGTIFMGGSHPAANGGAWMTTILGFGGVRATERQVRINPRLYPKWTRLEFHLVYQGDRFAVTITQNDVTILGEAANQGSREFVIGGKKRRCAPGGRISTKYQRPGAEMNHAKNSSKPKKK